MVECPLHLSASGQEGDADLSIRPSPHTLKIAQVLTFLGVERVLWRVDCFSLSSFPCRSRNPTPGEDQTSNHIHTHTRLQKEFLIWPSSNQQRLKSAINSKESHYTTHFSRILQQFRGQRNVDQSYTTSVQKRTKKIHSVTYCGCVSSSWNLKGALSPLTSRFPSNFCNLI